MVPHLAYESGRWSEIEEKNYASLESGAPPLGCGIYVYVIDNRRAWGLLRRGAERRDGEAPTRIIKPRPEIIKRLGVDKVLISKKQDEYHSHFVFNWFFYNSL